MPEYLSPGVYVEETSFRSKSIEGVSTTTTGFVGPCRYGPVDLESEVVTSLVEFERVFGDGADLSFRASAIGDVPAPRRNYPWHAVRAFFAEGGKRLYVARTFARFDNASTTDVDESRAVFYRGPDDDLNAGLASNVYPDGHARSITTSSVGPAPSTDSSFVLRARYPGAYGNFRVRVRAVLGQNLLVGPSASPIQGTLFDGDVVTVIAKSSATFARVGRHRAVRNAATGAWTFTGADGTERSVTDFPAADYEMRVVTLTVSASPLADPSREDVWAALAPDTGRATGGQPEGITLRLGYDAQNPSPNRGVPIVVRALKTTGPVSARTTSGITNGVEILSILSERRHRTAAVGTITTAGTTATTAAGAATTAASGAGTAATATTAAANAATAAATALTTLLAALPTTSNTLVTIAAHATIATSMRSARDAALAAEVAATNAERAAATEAASVPPPATATQAAAAAAAARAAATAARAAASAAATLYEAESAALNEFLDTGKVDANATPPSSDTREFVLAGGHDGVPPSSAHYAGDVSPTTDRRTGLRQFEDIEDISIVAAPGATAHVADDDVALDVCNQLIAHCRRMRYRIAVLDPRNARSIGEVRAFRARIDSSHAALYYPWVRVIDPNTRQPIHLPPSGFVAGIYARNDTERAVYKAPANEVVNLAVGFENMLNKSQQDVLNPEGVNCFRFFEGRGYRLWGARTASSDPEWKYVNLRRYFAYLERSIERGTQWAVFEPNGPALWGNVRRTIEDFLFNEFQSGALLGDKPDAAYFVKCDRSTMTQNDLDNGRLVCLIGAAVVRPAEFVIFRIGQWTGDRKV
jgi:phage tail sheath protein FI